MNPLKDTYEYNPYPYYLCNLLKSEYTNLAIPGSNLVNNIQIFIDNLQSIIDNGKMVIFQFQFFQNAYLRLNLTQCIVANLLLQQKLLRRINK